MDRKHTVITVPSECGNTTITVRREREPIPRRNAIRVAIDDDLPPADLDDRIREACDELRRDNPGAEIWLW